MKRAQDGLISREYRASANRKGLQAPNRAHNLRTYFEPSGIRVHDRTAPGSPELLALRLAGIGRGEVLAPVAPGTLASDGARVEIRRPGLVEWYENAPAGLEQGFTLAQRPPGDGPLLLDLAVQHARATLRDSRVILATPSGRRLAYSELVVEDAQGSSVAAHFELPGPGRLRIAMDDAGAHYPLTIDPILTEAADTQLEANQMSAELGVGVASAGDVNGDGYADVIVGARFYDAGEADEGAAFIFLGSAAGVADGHPGTAATQLESDQTDSQMGVSVAGAGDVNGDGYADVIVGAEQYDAGENNEGAAFVFLGSAAGVVDGNPGTAATQLEADQADAFLGFSVDGAGDVNGDGYADVIVGARSYDAGEADEGAAFIFLGSAAGIADGNPGTAATQLESDQVDAQFGRSVAGAGDVNGDGYTDVIVGAHVYDAGQNAEGAAFVFLGSAAGVADGDPNTAAAQLESNQADAQFGFDVAGAGDVDGDGYADVIVGARLYDAGEADEGAAFVFLGGAAGIADGDPNTAATQLESDQAGGQLGYSVAGAGDVNGDGYADVIAGALLYNAGEIAEGAAFLFFGSAAGIADGDPSSAAAQLESDQIAAGLGTSVAGAGDVNGDGYADVIVGALLYDAGESDEGAAFIFLGGATGVADGDPSTAAAQFESNQESAYLGVSVAGAGDVNGDGYADVIVGARLYDAGEADEGAAFVFHGSAAGVVDADPSTAAAQLESNQWFADLGISVAGAGDVNGDGYADVIVGASFYEAGEVGEGAAFIFHGSPAGIADGDPTTAAAQLESNQVDAWFGRSVAGAGDVNGDGYADVIVGAQLYDAGEMDEGAAFVFHGSAAGVANGNPTTAVAQLESDQAYAELGSGVAGAGDVNGDGYADVIVGANFYDVGSDEGAAFIFHGSAAGVADGDPSTAATQLESDQASAQLGSGVAGAGDVNGDGYADVIVGAFEYAAGENFEGAAFVFHGSAAGVADADPTTAATQLESNQAGAHLGIRVAGAGDVNGDGYADVIVGASGYSAGEVNEGAAFVFLGSAAGIADGDPSTAAAQFESDQFAGALGSSVAGAGDVNGDGYADVIVGAGLYDAGESQEGAALVFLGNGGRSVLARQKRADLGQAPVEPWGISGTSDSFSVEITAHHPAGSGRVKAQVEACPTGVAFGDLSCVNHLSATWLAVDGASPEVVITETLTGLTTDTLYRWRARVLHAPLTVTESGITSPPNPAHGPWRRHTAQANEADIRVFAPEPNGVLLLVSGMALLGVLHRYRRACWRSRV